MSSKIRTVILLLCSAVFVFCLATVLVVRLPYWTGRKAYQGASQSYTAQNDSSPAVAQVSAGLPDGADHSDADSAPEAAAAETEEPGGSPEYAVHSEKIAAASDRQTVAPIKVDFKMLQDINPDIIGWIYCEDTQIDYPVLLGATNDTYLRTLYNGEGHPAGSIFVDAANLPGFLDNNTIVYGHHMADGSMFGNLEDWREQEYFDAHPCMWLLTPEQDYRVDLFSAYLVSATHDTYTIFRGTGPELTAYLQRARNDSAVESSVELDPLGRYVLLSTCAYSVYDDARSVVHGMLVPVDSAD